MSRAGDKAAKVRRLLAAATTEGERQACEAALSRLLRESADELGSGLDLHTDLAELVASRQPLEGYLYRVIRRVGGEDLKAAVEDYRWNPSEDSFAPPPRELGVTEA
jgi:hypothetical protein